jgi:transposase
MPRSGPRAVRKYSDEFKLTAVRLSQQPGLQVKTVAAALEIHPFMLSKWRKDARDGRLRGRVPKAPPPGPTREIAQLQALEKAHALLHEEHELLKNAMRFCAARRATRSPSSTRSARDAWKLASLAISEFARSRAGFDFAFATLAFSGRLSSASTHARTTARYGGSPSGWPTASL